jgi:CheY-like chemotaxis protein
VQVKQAAERSAGLTRQLLAVSRHDAGEARVANLRGVIVEHVDMLGRLMSERIELHLDTEASRWNARIDPTELVQILMNLMVNARDAIDDTGVVSLEVRDVVADSALRKHHRDLEASEYVMVSVSDTGSGMDAETRERIFDPFFTTKGATEGSGLGLSTVYGIMRRHGGTVHVYSEPGEGTTFRLYFPRELRESEAHARAEPSEPVTGDERVLLVEDDPAVLKLARAALESQGYEVYAAQSVEEAWRVARQRNGALDLLLTDVIMPAKNGKELAAELRSLQPSLRVLFMSGYADDIVVRGDAGSRDASAVEEIHLIEKPFTVAGLAAKVREVLEA